MGFQQAIWKVYVICFRMHSDRKSLGAGHVEAGCQPRFMRRFRSRASDSTVNGLKGEDFMDQTKKIPAEAVDLYTRFIHGEIGRRDFLHGVERFAVTGLSAA